jgi:hypothetical protein
MLKEAARILSPTYTDQLTLMAFHYLKIPHHQYGLLLVQLST